MYFCLDTPMKVRLICVRCYSDLSWELIPHPKTVPFKRWKDKFFKWFGEYFEFFFHVNLSLYSYAHQIHTFTICPLQCYPITPLTVAEKLVGCSLVFITLSIPSRCCIWQCILISFSCQWLAETFEDRREREAEGEWIGLENCKRISSAVGERDCWCRCLKGMLVVCTCPVNLLVSCVTNTALHSCPSGHQFLSPPSPPVHPARTNACCYTQPIKLFRAWLQQIEHDHSQ